MMELSAELKSHVVCFIDRSYKYITKEKAENLLKLSTTAATAFELNGNYYDFKGVTKILSYADFCEEYPDRIKREVENTRPSYNIPDGSLHAKDYVKSKKHRELMIQGLKEFISENETTGKAEEMLEYMQSYDREQKLQEMPIGQLAV